MKEIQEFESIIEKLEAQGKPYWAVSKEEGNRRLLEAYYQSKERDNELIDFNEVIWERDVEPIVATLRRVGVKEFTFSSSMTGAIEFLAAFKKLGVAIQDVVYVNDYKKEPIPAMLLKVN